MSIKYLNYKDGWSVGNALRYIKFLEDKFMMDCFVMIGNLSQTHSVMLFNADF